MGRPVKVVSEVESLGNTLQESLCLSVSSRGGLFPQFVPRPRGKIDALPKTVKAVPVSRQVLVDLYVNQGKTRKELAATLGTTYNKIGYWLRAYKITLSKADRGARTNFSDNGSMLNGRRALSRRQKANASSNSHGRYGYNYIHNMSHPNCDNYGYVAEHRVLIEQVIGRFLKSGEDVHHVNLVRDDNRLINLMLFTKGSDHIKFHKWTEQCGLYTMGIRKTIQGKFKPAGKIFWNGEWLKEVDINSLTAVYSASA